MSNTTCKVQNVSEELEASAQERFVGRQAAFCNFNPVTLIVLYARPQGVVKARTLVTN